MNKLSSYFYTTEDCSKNYAFLGFWIYLMSDCLIFSSLFAVHAIMRHNYAAGPTGIDLFNLPLVLLNTFTLLLSSLTYSLSMVSVQKKLISQTLFWLSITGILGVSFVCLETYEFYHLIQIGAVPQRSGFLTSFFTLVATHGIHVVFGIIWLVVLIIQLIKHHFISENIKRLICLSMFWHFLDVIWIGVFTFVYLMGVLV